MSQGHVVKHSVGKLHPQNLYVQLKNNSVWVYEKALDSRQQRVLLAGIAERQGSVKLKYWIKVR